MKNKELERQALLALDEQIRRYDRGSFFGILGGIILLFIAFVTEIRDSGFTVLMGILALIFGIIFTYLSLKLKKLRKKK